MRTFGQKQTLAKQIKSAKSTRHHKTSLQRTLTANMGDVRRDMTTTEIARFGRDLSRIPVHASPQSKIQPKLNINAPSDVYEHEADDIASQIMSMHEPTLQRACACGGGCPKCQTENKST